MHKLDLIKDYDYEKFGCCNGKYAGNLEYANPMFDSVC